MGVDLAILLIVILVLLFINAFLIWQIKKINHKFDSILEGGKIKDFRDIFLSQKDKNDSLSEKIKEAFLKIKNLENISEKTLQKIGIVRFNPFNDMGGNQSFVIAILDRENNGFVISSVFINEGSRVYTKNVKKGKSEYALSKEEKEAIDKAINL